MKTKIFCDSADLKTIKEFNNNSLVSGFTTNPSLIRKAGAKNYKNYSLKLLSVCKKKPISLEVFADKFDEMIKQAIIINSWSKNVYVKIPVVNSKGIFTSKVINTLSNKGIKLNITAVYTVPQVRKIVKNLNKKSKTIISIFAGRMGDVGKGYSKSKILHQNSLKQTTINGLNTISYSKTKFKLEDGSDYSGDFHIHKDSNKIMTGKSHSKLSKLLIVNQFIKRK